jgi:hypothetical protein
MKITIKKCLPEVKETFIKDVPRGYVFEVLDGNRLLKLGDNAVVILTWADGKDWLMIKDESSWERTPVKILGKLIEIVVEK